MGNVCYENRRTVYELVIYKVNENVTLRLNNGTVTTVIHIKAVTRTVEMR